MYIWSRKGWPTFTWDNDALASLLAHVSREQGRLLGKMEGLGFDLRDEAHLQTRARRWSESRFALPSPGNSEWMLPALFHQTETSMELSK
ncbi:MAG: DUF4172 domain-containing protein [Congregibacter sp.]|nr:DUF4172 domain-containing protein [Congregibacter sp.]